MSVSTRTVRRRVHVRRRRVILGVFLAIVLVVGGMLAYTAYHAQMASSKVFRGGGNLADLVTGEPLDHDAQGRTAIVVFGTSQDDASHANGPGGQGMWLTDSIQMLVLDPKHHSTTMVAIPRDLWVKQPQKCIVGSGSKINAIYECGAGFFDTPQSKISAYNVHDAAGAGSLTKVLGDVTGITPQYWVHVDYSALRDAVDAVGGIDINITGDGADGIFDANLDLHCSKDQGADARGMCHMVDYPHNGNYHLDGLHSLALARARGDYKPGQPRARGLAHGDADRQANQQKIMEALRAQAMSAGVLTNPEKVNSLIEALSNHVSTNLSVGQARTLANDLGASQKTVRFGIASAKTPLLKNALVHGQAALAPMSGTYDYNDIRRAVAEATGGPMPTYSAPTATDDAQSSGASKTMSSGNMAHEHRVPFERHRESEDRKSYHNR
ncbi:LCP family protein [Devriesea agamarum]|uniref:LCP family protein n=1 Tax=Devriesea agamarum TaxID=472569 RepID=UPI00071E61A7|nr:LCP family protein [Devriesea agamarum]